MLPLALLMAVGCLDAARYLSLAASADQTALALADAVSRADAVRDRPAEDDLTQSTDTGAYFALARILAQPLDLGTSGAVTISSVTGGGAGAATVNWMRATGPAAGADPGRLATLPPLPAGRAFIVAEVFFEFEPAVVGRAALASLLGEQPTIYRRALFRTRSAPLTTLAAP
ncbi:hypothetical protein SAMN05444370_10792 [Rubrimonas cliftonensis]|uniref:Flp pilus-assembly TadE/G-like n=2 Tax=Rubrimonas cliftonensis TaxID=89524 RepID=A0A1H4CIF5_9RHOB|nr:hypothetical protein SAMN05444370_10792 [Rubrimonas cliftonensis]